MRTGTCDESANGNIAPRQWFWVYAFASVLLTVTSLWTAQAEAQQSIFLIGISNSAHSSNFYVESDKLPSHLAWNPEKNPFPLDLSVAVRNASKRIIDLSLEEPPEPKNLEIIRIPEGMALPNASDLGQMTNQWMLTFEFWQGEAVHTRFAVMLLDGTWAYETNYLKENPLWSGASTFRSVVGTNDAGKAIESINSVDFKVARIQWSPDAEPFPLSLKSEAARALSYLSKSHPAATQMYLKKISIKNHVPMRALLSQGLDPLEHFHHWLLVFEFGQGFPGARRFDVYMDLDGRIIE